ncbi:MAG: peptidase U32 [Desulfuromonas sp.]|nr:MAG: peptidase U32 [Desulfuromonas sp.]
MSRTVELLAPAGDSEKLTTALAYGADAVYLGAPRFGLRAQAGNFDREALKEAIEKVHEQGKRLYLTLNAFLRPGEITELETTLEELRPLGVDAYIVADTGVLETVRRIDPQRPLHLSTQANTTNAAAVRFWQQVGVSRINLARELSLEEIRQVRAGCTADLEVFVHGAMCVAYSGRCLLSAALTGRNANAGACAHPCRWEYTLQEKSRPGEIFTLAEDERGSYLFNSRDLCLIEHLPALLDAGVDSFKIEGRMKSRYYLAAVLRVYRAALDATLANPDEFALDPLWREELDKVSHRPYDSGFLFPGAAQEGRVHAADSHYRRSHDFIGIVHTVDDKGWGDVEGRNRFFVGETIELIGPAMRQQSFVVEQALTQEGAPLPVVQPNARVRIKLPPKAEPGDLLRRRSKA